LAVEAKTAAPLQMATAVNRAALLQRDIFDPTPNGCRCDGNIIAAAGFFFDPKAHSFSSGVDTIMIRRRSRFLTAHGPTATVA
jgi:hypothetical protein